MGIVDMLTLVFSAGALAGVVWQIARHEGVQPKEGWLTPVKVTLPDTNGVRLAQVLVRPAGPARRYEVTWTLNGALTQPTMPERFAVLDAAMAPLALEFALEDGAACYVDIRWMAFSRVRRSPVMQCRRVHVSPTIRFETWTWSRLRRAGGRWKPGSRPRRRESLPEDV